MAFVCRHFHGPWPWRQQRQTKRRHVQGMLDEIDPLNWPFSFKLFYKFNYCTVDLQFLFRPNLISKPSEIVTRQQRTLGDNESLKPWSNASNISSNIYFKKVCEICLCWWGGGQTHPTFHSTFHPTLLAKFIIFVRQRSDVLKFIKNTGKTN